MKKLSVFIFASLFLALAGLSACSNSKNKSGESQPEQSAATDPKNAQTKENDPVSPQADMKKAPVVEYDMLFEYVDEEAGDRIEFNGLLDELGMHFLINSVNPKEECQHSIQGLAKAKDGDPEIRETTDGEARPVTEYFYGSPECSLSIFFDSEMPDLIWVEQYDCEEYEYNCPFGVAIPLERIP